MIRGVLIKNGKLTVVDTEDTLDSWYKLLDCELIDIVERDIGGTIVSIICDDEGLYNESHCISMMSRVTHQPMLVGPIFICNAGRDGNMASLTEEQIQIVKRQFKFGCVWGDYVSFPQIC